MPDIDNLILVFVVGLIASIADYGLGVGYGLIAAPILFALAGIDPRVVITSTLIAQLASSIPALMVNSKIGRIKPRLDFSMVLALSAAVGVFAGAVVMSLLPPRAALVVYIICLSIVGLAALTLKKSNRDSGGLSNGSLRLGALGLAGLAAGVAKSLSGGGFSPIIVVSQRALGAGFRESVASLPLVKPLAFAVGAIAYGSWGFLDPWLSAALTAGTLAGLPLAPLAASRIPEWLATILVASALAVGVAKGVLSIT
ncbi:MAG: sulfite exporter TauE/SafE family protein [Aeropyrum sp.]|nr:sulfite exporter TauE/SafE family protein [Aeropyrum sp.]